MGLVEKREVTEGRNTGASLITRLSDELLFTLENVEKHAHSLKQERSLPRNRRQTLDQMLEDTRRMNGLLKELMNTIRPEAKPVSDLSEMREHGQSE